MIKNTPSIACAKSNAPASSNGTCTAATNQTVSAKKMVVATNRAKIMSVLKAEANKGLNSGPSVPLQTIAAKSSAVCSANPMHLPACTSTKLISTTTTTVTNGTALGASSACTNVHSNGNTNANGGSTAAPATTTTGAAAPTVRVENAELRIIIIDENWSQYCYRIKINTPFGKLINRFCQQVRKIDHKSVLFWYHGRLVEDEDTPKTLNIKDGEVILAHYIK